jgi:hypothetical protein
VVVGRVTANNGFGIPNARVSIFIPITPVDESNPIISSIYPYKSPNDKNEDGYRYNLLPYEKSYSSHSATGTLPSRLDVLTGSTAVEIYDKYYKYSTKTNESGDYMIMGVPQGNHTLVMDVDLSDIGEFSLTPQDLIRMGLTTEAQVGGSRFNTSTDLNSLPQIVNLTKDVQISPLWGDPELCDIAVNRVDFDLRDDANIDIQPTSVFMGSIYSTSDTYRIRPNAKPADDMGNLCSLTTGPGQILTIRQTIYQDNEGNPVLEQHQLEQSGNIIDGNGVWLTELPMNLDYFITNEFGEKVLSNDPTVGIPTKAKYRFKIKWSQSPNLSEQVRRPYYLLPNVKEYGWSSSFNDPNLADIPPPLLPSSYYFGLAWSGYTNGFSKTINPPKTTSPYLDRINEIINCEDTFYEFQYNKVYTVTGLIDEFKNGGRANFIGIKEINNRDCESTINTFPVNEGFKNFDLLYFLFSIVLLILQLIGPILLLIYHLVAFLWNNFAVILVPFLAAKFFGNSAFLWKQAAAAIKIFPKGIGLAIVSFAGAIFWSIAGTFIITNFLDIVSKKIPRLKLPMMTYPDCQACDCNPDTFENDGETTQAPQGILSQLSNNLFYYDTFVNNQIQVEPKPISEETEDNINLAGLMYTQAMFGRETKLVDVDVRLYKSTTSPQFKIGDNNFSAFATTLPPGERINLYNTRQKYFESPPGARTTGTNRISVRFNYPRNGGRLRPGQGFFRHTDNTLTVLSTQSFEPGTLLTFVNKSLTTDVNYLWSGNSFNYPINGINGVVKSKPFQQKVRYAYRQTKSDEIEYELPGVPTECVLNFVLSAGTSGRIIYNQCSGAKLFKDVLSGETITIDDPNGIDISTVGGIEEFKILSSGDTCQRYKYPADIEYYQVLTAITITKVIRNGKPEYSIPNLGPNYEDYGFWSVLNAQNAGYYLQDPNLEGNWRYAGRGRADGNTPPTTLTTELPTNSFLDFESQVILILQRGVDPYSPLMPNAYGIGKILGWDTEEGVVITGLTRTNIPIQPILDNSPISVQDHKKFDEIFLTSHYYSPGIPGTTTPGLTFSSYTTSNVGFYGALDATYVTPPPSNVSKKITSLGTDYFGQGIYQYKPTNSWVWTGITYGVKTISVDTTLGVNTTGVGFNWYNNPLPTLPSLSKYSPTDDLSGAAYMGVYPPIVRKSTEITQLWNGIGSPLSIYFSPILLPQFTQNTGPNSKLLMNNSNNIIMRTDRLPSSDTVDVQGYTEDDLSYLNNSVALLQQNLSFGAYSEGGDSFSAKASVYGTGAQQVTADIEGQSLQLQVFDTMNTCENMVGLNGYSGNGVNFGVKLDAKSSDSVEEGCYVMVNSPLFDYTKDLKTFDEWGYRFRFFYGLCRGVLAQTFTNNWVNGSLYMFPIQVDTKYSLIGVPDSVFARQIVFFDKPTNTFYYRSSPYNQNSSKFIGRATRNDRGRLNAFNLLFPTTIVNLGYKDDFYGEITFDPSAKGYIMGNLTPTTYSDTSDLINLFVISRITNSGFLGTQIMEKQNSSIDSLFSRKELRIDGDLAQSLSINSEFGVIPFSPQFYNVEGKSSDPVVILQEGRNQIMGIFFSSTTFDLQNKDYLSPGIINFRPSFNVNAVATYEYGIKSQEVPFYQWGIKLGSSIFGTEKNDWATEQSNIFSQKYQSLSRRNPDTQSNPSYFMSSNAEGLGDISQRGYIFGVNTTGGYAYGPSSNPDLNVGNFPNNFLVGAPNHFYFGIIKGETAIDKFKTKYSVDE